MKEIKQPSEKKEASTVCDACQVGKTLGKTRCPLHAGFRWVKGGLLRLAGKETGDKTK